MKSIIRKQVTFTHIHSAKIVKDDKNNLTTETLPVVTLLGNISEPKCKRHMRAIDADAQVYDIHYETVTYAMKLDDFMEHGYIDNKEGEENE